ncbi:MAG: helix-turn-helix domain-containing protein [Anaerovoracaceae bacterium]
MELDWITPQQAAQLWNISERRNQSLCAKGRVKGARKIGRAWLIPKDMPKPIDGRTVAGRVAHVEKQLG